MQVLRPAATALLAVAAWWLLGDSLSGALTLILVGLSVFAASVIQGSIFHSRQGKLLAGAQDSASHSQEYHPAELSRTAFPIFVTRIASVIIEYSNVLLVGFLAGPAQAGAYFAAERLAQLALIPPSIMSSVCQPELAAANAMGNPQLLRGISRRAVHGGLWPTVAIGLISILLAGPLLSLFGDNFTSATPVLVILIVGLILKTALGPVEDLLLMTGHQRVLPRVMLITAIFHLLSLSVLVPLQGAAGAALTSALSGLLSSFWLMRLVKDKVAINPTILAGRT
jgi:O-antigen/teichoic acid export membrane protein